MSKTFPAYDGGGSATDAFERAFARYRQARHCLAIANGTVAIEAALKAVGMRPGDEVIVPAVTFIATASAVNMPGGLNRSPASRRWRRTSA